MNDISICEHCGGSLIRSNDPEFEWEHTETGSPYCWDESDVEGKPEGGEENESDKTSGV